MEYMKNKILIYISALFALWGVYSLFFLWNGAQPEMPFYVANIIFHAPLLAGFVWLIWKGKPRRRLHAFWTPLGLVMIIWPILTVVFAEMFDEDYGAERLLVISETLWYGLAFGLLIGFHSIKSLGKFWYFLVPITIGWNLWLFSLFQQALGIPTHQPPGSGAPTLESYFRSGKFWNDWGWFLSDMVVDVTTAVTAALMIIIGLVKKLKR